MSLNRTKIEWCDISWNVVTGCNWNCWYCYAKKLFTRFHKSFEPTFYPERLKELEKLKKPSKIFVCSVSDIFADWTKPEWKEAILNKIKEYPQHTYQLLTKQPQNIDKDYNFRKNIWIGATITKQSEIKNINYIGQVKCGIRFISFEPLLEDVGELDLRHIDWIIIGKLTGSKKIKLEEKWVYNIISQARYFDIPIFIKNNLNWKEKIQEFPIKKVLI